MRQYLKFLLLCLVFGLKLSATPAQAVYVITNNRVEVFDMAGHFIFQFGASPMPTGIAIDPVTNAVWVADAALNQILEYSVAGTLVMRLGSTGSAPGQFYQPYGLAVDNQGNLWVADTGNNRVQEFRRDGLFLQSLGSLGGGNGQFNHPVGIAIATTTDPTTNTLFVADTGNYRVEEFSVIGGGRPVFVGSFGSYGNGFAQFKGPFQLATGTDVNGNVLAVADPYNQRIFVSRLASFNIDTVFTYPSPFGVARDAAGNFWATDYNANLIYEFDMNGNKLLSFGVTGGGSGQLYHPTYLAIGILPT